MNKKELNTRLSQKSIFYGESHTFEIYNHKFIKIISSSLLKKRSYHLNLSMLAPWPVQHNVASWPAVLSLIFISACFLIYLLNFQTAIEPALFLPTYTLICSGGFIFFYKSKNIIEFKSRYGNCVVLSLLSNSPNKKDVKKFTGEIHLRSLTASQEMDIDITQMLTIEMDELKRLKNEGIISHQNYSAAKKRIDKVTL